MPVSGEVIEINTALKDNAPLVNTASFTDVWMIKIKLSDKEQINPLLGLDAYQTLVS